MTMRTNDNGVDRDMTDDEIVAYQLLKSELDSRIVVEAEAAAAKATARAALLNRLGITVEEAQLLLGGM